ncbi:MAG TPA: response regulator [Ktedonobacteraceae bacterium]|jgi:diguanylate cyclase (GGDEF)-like protein|nr:response regulator [Ktedonobacteraceae bacterium]
MSSILVVESERLVTGFLQENLGVDEYYVAMIPNGKDAVRFALRDMPALIVIDATLPGIDTYQLIQRLRDHPKSMHIPIILLSAHTSLAEKVQALEAGVDSYIVKPFNHNELSALVHRHLSRVQQTSLSPLTRLPGGLQLERAIDYKLRGLKPWSILYLDLDNFKAFNDAYGFLSGNDMILLVGYICQRIVYDYGNDDDFVGHVGGDDFVIVTTPDREDRICERILAVYKQESAALYRDDDLKRGTISGADRKGRPFQFPLVSLSIGVVSDPFRCSHGIDEVGTLAAEAKLCAKRSSSNIFCISSQWNNVYSDHSSISAIPVPLPTFLRSTKRGLFNSMRQDVFAEI